MHEHVTAAVQRMVTAAGCEQELADAVAIFEGWTLKPEERRRRMMQCWRARAGHARRQFSANWVPIAVRLVAYFGGDDLVSPILDEARYRGRREREEHGDIERVRVHRVRGTEQGRRRA